MSKSKKRQQTKRRVQKRRSLKPPTSSRINGGNNSAPGIAEQACSLSPKDLLRFYLGGKHEELSQGILFILSKFANQTFVDLTPQQQAGLDMFTECLLYLMTKGDYVIPPAFRKQFVLAMPVIANLVTISRFETTDPQLEILPDQPNSLPKILALYSARNKIKIDYKWLFDQDPKLVSIWYGHFFHANDSSGTQRVYENLQDHLKFTDDRYDIEHYVATGPIFYSAYLNARMERPIKERINKAIRQKLTDVRVRNNPNPRSIAILTDRWSPNTSVYRGLRPFVEALANCYDLTLVHLGNERSNLDVQVFRDVRRVHLDRNNSKLHAESLIDNDFQAVFYPDVGLNVESRYLSNLRIAPIQMVGYGHPTSTFGSQIDY
ncbi:MAG: hypothetical protein ACYSTL_02535, partial [Planctomycetota bacterium]